MANVPRDIQLSIWEFAFNQESHNHMQATRWRLAENEVNCHPIHGF